MHEITLRQRIARESMVGRVNAADSYGIPRTLWIGAAGVLASCLWLLPVAKAGSATIETAAAAQ